MKNNCYGFSECYCLLCYLTASSPSGVTLQGGLRRKPNCFNLLHQMRLLEKVKGAVDEFNEASTSHLIYLLQSLNHRNPLFFQQLC